VSDRSVCFFAKVKDRDVLSRVEFYAQDIRILESLGFDVHIATALSEIRSADLFFVWWWTWAFFPVMLATLLDRPSLITGTFNTWLFDQRPALHRRMLRFVLKHAAANVFVSQLEYKQTPRILPVNNPCYSPHIVDTTVYRPGNQVRDDTVLTIAWMHTPNAKRKCIPEVIRAAAMIHNTHPRVRFIIAGEHASHYPFLVQMVEDLDAASYIEFPGVVSRDAKIELMQRCKVYLQPSRYEGFGLAILEAMSCGAAVVTSPAGAVPEVVGNTAILVDGTSPEEIAAAVKNLLEESDIREALGHQARTRAETFFPYERRKRDLLRIISEVF